MLQVAPACSPQSLATLQLCPGIPEAAMLPLLSQFSSPAAALLLVWVEPGPAGPVYRARQCQLLYTDHSSRETCPVCSELCADLRQYMADKQSYNEEPGEFALGEDELKLSDEPITAENMEDSDLAEPGDHDAWDDIIPQSEQMIERNKNSGLDSLVDGGDDPNFKHEALRIIEPKSTEISQSFIKCDECGKLCRSAKSLVKHMINVHKIHTFQCDKCKRGFISAVTLEKHSSRQCLQNQECKICGQCISHSKHKCDCPFCDRKFSIIERTKKSPGTGRLFKIHLQTFHFADREKPEYVNIMNSLSKENYQCLVSVPHQLNNHTELKHDFNEMRVPCPQCGKNVKYLKVHVARVHSRNTFLCTECGAEFKDKSTMERHTNKIHTHTTQEVQCSECGKKLVSNRKLRTHVKKMHLNLFSISCSQCSKNFNYSDQVKSHIITVHTNIKPFVCEVCGYKSSKLFNLNLHRKKQHQIPKSMSTSTLRNMVSLNMHPFCTAEDLPTLYIVMKSGKLFSNSPGSNEKINMELSGLNYELL